MGVHKQILAHPAIGNICANVMICYILALGPGVASGNFFLDVEKKIFDFFSLYTPGHP